MAKIVSMRQKEEVPAKEGPAPVAASIKNFEAVIEKDPLAEKAYDRLLILYRKGKEYKKELKLLNAGIKAFESFYRSKKSRSGKVAALSKKLNLSFGFTDKKGNALYDPQPVARWKKRKATVLKRIK